LKKREKRSNSKENKVSRSVGDSKIDKISIVIKEKGWGKNHIFK